MKLKILSILALTISATTALAQNEDDAIRYSNIVPLGTAKFISMGGAMGAIGGDMSAIAINPAGVGIYRTEQISLSPTWTTDKVSAKYYGTSANNSTSSFKFSNVGIVTTFPAEQNLGCMSFSMGLVYNRMANFEGGYTVKGFNAMSSMLDKEVDDFNADVWDGNQFYKADLFVYDSAVNKYFNDYELAGEYGANQRKSVSTSGSMGEYDISLGLNFSNKWYLGGSLNIMRINYRQMSKYIEEPDIDNFAFSDFTVTDEFVTTGCGVNMKFGLIGWLSENLRVGAAFHTPTILTLSDDYGTRVESNVWYNDKDGEYKKYSDNESNSGVDWNLTLPAKFIGSLAIVSPEHGMLDIDCEVVNYSSTILDDADGYIGNEYDDLNDRISDIYRTTVNLRVGGEMTFGPAVARAGFGFYGSPYKSGYENASSNKLVYSVGLGWRSQHASIDLGYSLTTQKETTYLYGFDDSAASLKRKNGNLALTFGVRF
ncbi:MAG: hypothetical protein J6X32_02150 [Salinivirgaceae bacterium]|nr:hypothetical protein [Salinivirgaceae bacterium]